ncbi:aldehyde dehydrogenase family protein [Ureibacillus sp. NPDC094379]
MLKQLGIFKDINKQFIQGKWMEGNSETIYEITNPYDNTVVNTIKLGNKHDIDEAYAVAKRVQKSWEKTSKEEKVNVLEKTIKVIEENKDIIVESLVKEGGSSILKANVEIQLTLGLLNEAKTFPYRMEPKIEKSQIPGKENHIFREAAGVVSVISPFNFPFYLSMRSIIPALFTGNSVVHKPDLQTPISGGTIIGKIFELASLPQGVLNVVVVDINEIGDYFVEHSTPRIISFTGSTAVGLHIGSVATKSLKRVSLELGGNSPFIVLKDADVNKAVEASIFGKFLHQGQICMCINRIFVHKDLYPDFVEKFVQKASQLPYGDPSNPDNIIGPLINEKQIIKILDLVANAKTEGANVALEGQKIGNILTPTVLTEVNNEMNIAQNEIFGPVASIIPFEDDNEVIEIANNTNYGLSASIFTSNLDKGIEFARNIETGMCHINDQTINDEPTVPFGGEKLSGMGRFGGDWGIEEFTTMKWVSVQKEYREFPF